MRTAITALLVVCWLSSGVAVAQRGHHSAGGSRSHSSHSYSGRSTNSYRSGHHSYSTGSSGHVRSYTRRNGTTVHGYTRRYRSSGLSHHGSTTARSHSTHSSAACATCTRDSHGHIRRRSSARSAFMRSHPCPSTGKTSGACPGYVVDHIQPLKRGGADVPSNMQWQTVEAAKAKDKSE